MPDIFPLLKSAQLICWDTIESALQMFYGVIDHVCALKFKKPAFIQCGFKDKS
jgi:hypothetical protein